MYTYKLLLQNKFKQKNSQNTETIPYANTALETAKNQ